MIFNLKVNYVILQPDRRQINEYIRYASRNNRVERKRDYPRTFKNRLSKKGKQEVELVAKKYKEIKFDVIYASPMMRTMQTANIMNRYHNLKIIKYDRLMELDQGIFTGKVKARLSPEEKIQRISRNPNCGMESYESAFTRTKDFADFLKTLNFKNILVVSHNINTSCLENILTKQLTDFKTPSTMNKFKNADIKQFKC